MLAPTHIILHKQSRLLEIRFASGEIYQLPAAYLRAYSPSAAAKHQPRTGYESIAMVGIEPVGQYAIKIIFDDNHRSGLYTWETLYELGARQTETSSS